MDHSSKTGRCIGVVAALISTPLAAAPADVGGLEEIIVTAQKQEQKLGETPLSVTALSAKDLEALGATQFRDFANTVPGLSFTTSGAGATQINLRGITSGGSVSPTVGIYVDEVPYGSSTAFAGAAQLALDAGLFDLSRVEVLRGPQGTLYGASTMGGLLKYVTTAPDLHNLGGTARAGLSTTDHGGTSYDVASAVNLPFGSDKAAARVSGFYSKDGGYVDNVGLGEDDVNQSDVYGGRADVLFQPSEELSVRLNAYVQKIDRDGTSQVDYDIATGKPIDGDLEHRTILPQPFDQNYEMYSATAVYDFGPAALTSVTSYQSLSNDSFLDGSTLFVPTFNFLFSPGNPFGLPELEFGAVGIAYGIGVDKFTQELRLAGTGPTIDWLVGGFYTNEDSNQTQVIETFDPDLSPIAINMTTIKLPSSYEETAGFGTVTWHATSKLDLAGGLRYSHNSQAYTQNTSGIISGLLAPARPEAKSSEDVTTYLANLRYLANDNLMSYFRFATGYRPGGPNFTGQDPLTGEPIGNPAFESDKLQSYEGGIKVSTDDRRFSADAAVYLIDWDNMQVVSSRNGVGVVANANTARSTGAELTLTALPVPDLTLVGTLAYIDAQLTEDAPDLGGRDGDPLPDTPDFAGTISGDYAFNIGEHESTVGALVRYVGERVSGFSQSGIPPAAGSLSFDLDDYATVDLRGSIDFGSATLRLYVRNVSDERGQLSAETVLTQAGGPANVSILQPRTYGMSVDVQF